MVLSTKHSLLAATVRGSWDKCTAQTTSLKRTRLLHQPCCWYSMCQGKKLMFKCELFFEQNIMILHQFTRPKRERKLSRRSFCSFFLLRTFLMTCGRDSGPICCQIWIVKISPSHECMGLESSWSSKKHQLKRGFLFVCFEGSEISFLFWANKHGHLRENL